MSAEASRPEDEVVNLGNVPKELARHLTTVINYVRRQGLRPYDIKAVVELALAPAPSDAPVRVVPELLDKGIDDRRDGMRAASE